MTQRISRRRFLRAAGAAAAAAGGGVLLQGCRSRLAYDIVIKDGLVYDGLGRPPAIADVGISGARISAVGRIPASRGRLVIEARDRAVAPGFIDVHDHSDLGLLVNPRAESAVRQGVTTVISGQCGSSPFPIAEEIFEESRENAKSQLGIDLDWRDLGGFLGRLEKSGLALNYATLVGHGSVRGAAMGFHDRAPKPEELEKMKGLVAEAMKQGAFGLSSGLEYTPGSFAAPEEIVALCRVVAAAGGVYASHMRDEGDGLIESLEETIGAARVSGVRLQISHLKTAFPRNWSKIDAALAVLDAARQEGIDVNADRYPYIAGSTGLSINFPAWARQGTTEEFLGRLKDPYQDKPLRKYVAEREAKLGSWDKVVLSEVLGEANQWMIGLTVSQASVKAGKPPYELMRDLLIEERGGVGSILFMMSEDNLRRILAHPLVGIGSDGSIRAPYGVLSTGKPHPRVFGSFARVLGHYIRREKLLPAETMIMKMTSQPAAKFGLEGRGVVRPGAFADLVVYNPAAIVDRATWTDPHRYPAGVDHVFVNGVEVVSGAEHTGRLAGHILRKKPVA